MTLPLIKIILIGEYSIFRSALRMFLEKEKHIRVVGEAAEKAKALEIIAIEKPSLVLVDLADYREEDVLPFLETLTMPVLLLVGPHSPEIYHNCLKMGINGLVRKQESGVTLLKAIEKVHAGEIWFDRTIMGETIRQLLEEKRTQHENPGLHIKNALTLREMEVVELVCKGLKNKVIAEKLFITETTVRHHLTSVFNKIEISSRLELVVYAFKNGLVASPEKLGLVNANILGNGKGHTNGSSGRGHTPSFS